MSALNTMTDGELLAEYISNQSDAAFTALVARHINLVYAAAVRQTRDLTHAEDITQSVFTELARKARGLAQHPSLAGWLFLNVRYTASAAHRNQQRRAQREREAMHTITTLSEPELDWTQIRPLLDETLSGLNADDREAVLLRHFEDRPYADIGRHLGLTENAARMRVDRALDRLHSELSRRGVTSTGAALALRLAAHAAPQAPTGMAAKIASTSLAGASVGFGLTHFVFSKAAAAVAVAILAVLVGITMTTAPKTTATPTVKQNVAPSTDISHSNAVAQLSTPLQTNAASHGIIRHKNKWTNALTLHLTIVTADSGKPIPSVPLELRAWRDNKFYSDKFVSDRSGLCDVTYANDTTSFELTSQKEPFADTVLAWNPTASQPMPKEYLLKLDRAATISGQVLDPDGNPLANAQVGFNHEDRPETLTHPQSHRFAWVETKTDMTGHWSITRIAPEMIPDIYGHASHADFVGSRLVFGHDKKIAQQLSQGNLVFKLSPAVTVRGIVLGEDGLPVDGANVLVGRQSMDGSRTGKTGANGSFEIKGCGPTEHVITAKIKGYAATTLETNLSSPVQLTLQRGRNLTIHLVDSIDKPITRAWVSYSGNFPSPRFDPKTGNMLPPPAASPQIEFSGYTDSQGDLKWNDAPAKELEFATESTGHYRMNFTVASNTTAHTVKVGTALTVHGTVTDATSGAPITQFRLIPGWPNENVAENTTNASWTTMGRYCSDFAGGKFSKTMEEPLVYGVENRGSFFKITAEGYAPFVSRLVGPEEKDVQLDATLQPSQLLRITVLQPDGRPAQDLEVGFVMPESRLELEETGFQRQNQAGYGALVRTDRKGQFTLGADPSIRQIVAAASGGFAHATFNELTNNLTLQLQPWGNLEVLCQSNGTPVAGAEFHVDFPYAQLETITFKNMSYQTTDASGKTVFTNVPPGQMHVARVFMSHQGTTTSMQMGEKLPVLIPSGGTTNITIEANENWPLVRLSD